MEINTLSFRSLVLATFMLGTAPSQAALLQFNLTGSIDDALAGTSIGVGAPFAASFVLDTNAPVTSAGASTNTYETPYSDVAFQINGVTPTTVQTGTENLARALNDNQLDIYFNFDITELPFFGGTGGSFAQFFLQFFSSDIPIYSSTAELSTIDLSVLEELTPAFTYLSAGPGNLSEISMRVEISELPQAVTTPGMMAIQLVGLFGVFGIATYRRRQLNKPT